MALRDQLDADMKQAMRSRDSIRLETVRAVRGAVRNKEIELAEELDDLGIQRVIRTLAKQRGEAIEQFRAGGREELAAKEQREKELLEAYLPQAPDAAQVQSAVAEVIAELAASGPKDMGRVMKAALARLGPAADGKQVSGTVKQLLAELAQD